MASVRTVVVDYCQCAVEIRAVRDDVFVEEQQVPAELEIDGLDDQAVHVLAYDADQPIGTGRMLADGHIGRIAVHAHHRGRGVGTLIVQALVDAAVAARLDAVWLSSQCHAVGFYERLGFAAYGEMFVEAGIDHIHMRRVLTPAATNTGE